MRPSSLALAAAGLVLAAGLAGCIQPRLESPSTTGTGPPDDADPRCGHPWPCGNGTAWPRNLTGPFELGRTLTDPIESHDGTPLEATIYVPDLPGGVEAPVVLWSQPYTGGCAVNVVATGKPCMPASDSEYIYEGGYRIDPSFLVEHGYAVAIVNVRGTGNSGGCFDFGGRTEQRDQAYLVRWLADQPWSNGRVAMYGHSYHGWTPWQAAVQAPPALKTIVTSGVITDPYTFTFSPQGAAYAAYTVNPWFNSAYSASVNFVPPLGGGPRHATLEHASRFPDRLCPGVAEVLTETPKASFTDRRDGGFWDERRLTTRLPNVTAAVLVSHGLEDDNHHAFQEDDIWGSLPEDTPKRMILGDWGHELPPPEEDLRNAPFGPDWRRDTLLPWLDHWLKGLGEASDLDLGTVHYQDQTSDWHRGAAWPPEDADREVLYLAPDGSLSGTPQDGVRRFEAAPDGDGDPQICPGRLPDRSPRASLVYVSDPVEEPVRLAGNPFAHLRLESSLPGGIVTVSLYDVATGDCSREPEHTLIAEGAADLRFHRGNYQGQAFPTGEPTPVRVDVYNDAWVLKPGHRLAVVVSADGADQRGGQPYFPRLAVHGADGPRASHVVLPVDRGTLGGEAPTLDYPPQPFLPGGGS